MTSRGPGDRGLEVGPEGGNQALLPGPHLTHPVPGGHRQLSLAPVPSRWVLTPLLISKAPSLPANSNMASLLYSWDSQVLGTREGAQEAWRGHY